MEWGNVDLSTSFGWCVVHTILQQLAGFVIEKVSNKVEQVHFIGRIRGPVSKLLRMIAPVT